MHDQRQSGAGASTSPTTWAQTAWRLRNDLVQRHQGAIATRKASTLAKQAIQKGAVPCLSCSPDHSDRTGAATWLLNEIIDQKLSGCLIGTIADEDAINALRKKGVKVGDALRYGNRRQARRLRRQAGARGRQGAYGQR